MRCEQENKEGEDQRAPLHANDMDRPGTSLPDASASRMRRRAERRQSSALIAFWGEADRRSGADQRASPGGNDLDDVKR